MGSWILPPGEQLHRAVQWINEERSLNPKAPPLKIIEEACVRFDLSPAQEEWLLRMIS